MNVYKIEIKDDNEKYAIGSATLFLTKSIVRPLVFTENTRQRER